MARGPEAGGGLDEVEGELGPGEGVGAADATGRLAKLDGRLGRQAPEIPGEVWVAEHLHQADNGGLAGGALDLADGLATGLAFLCEVRTTEPVTPSPSVASAVFGQQGLKGGLEMDD